MTTIPRRYPGTPSQNGDASPSPIPAGQRTTDDVLVAIVVGADLLRVCRCVRREGTLDGGRVLLSMEPAEYAAVVKAVQRADGRAEL